MGVRASQPQVITLGPHEHIPSPKHRLLLLDELTPCAYAAFRKSFSEITTAAPVAVHIKQLSGANIAAQLPNTSTLRQLKAAIAERLPDAPPPERQRLLIGRRVLDGDPLSVVHLKDDDVIFVTLAAAAAAAAAVSLTSDPQPGPTSRRSHITHHRFAVSKTATVADVLQEAQRVARERWRHPNVARRVLVTRANGDAIRTTEHARTLEGGKLWLVLDSVGPANKAELLRWVGRWFSPSGKKGLSHIAEWDVSNVTDTARLFQSRRTFNDDISGWDTSKVTRMDSMFSGAATFNQPIGAWDTSQVTRMDGMFYQAAAFNQPIGEWDTSKVTRMDCMFWEAAAFNQPIGKWDTGKVTHMYGMFRGAACFNQPIGEWDMSKVAIMQAMFYEASTFNQPIGKWDTSQVTTMREMFRKAAAFNQSIGEWDTNKVKDMGRMFLGAAAFKAGV